MKDTIHETGNMIQARYFHTVSVVKVQDYTQSGAGDASIDPRQITD